MNCAICTHWDSQQDSEFHKLLGLCRYCPPFVETAHDEWCTRCDPVSIVPFVPSACRKYDRSITIKILDDVCPV